MSTGEILLGCAFALAIGMIKAHFISVWLERRQPRRENQ